MVSEFKGEYNMIKPYEKLTKEEKLKTYYNYQELCKKDSCMIPYESFHDYDCEQMVLNMDFNTTTLECLG